MGDVTPVTPTSPQPPAAIEPAPAASQVVPVQSPPVSVEQVPTLEELLAKVQRLEGEKNAAEQRAEQFKLQFETAQAARNDLRSLQTTTTKPTYLFSVSGKRGTCEFRVVDESEAKRLYAIKTGLDPSEEVFKVVCLEHEKRRASILDQVKQSNDEAQRQNLGLTIPERVPGVSA